MMNRRLLLINAGLAVVLLWGGVKIRQSWQAFSETHRAEAVVPESDGIRIQPVVAPPAANQAGVVMDWTQAAAQNPFSFDRNDIDVVVEAPPAAQAPSTPVPILYGTLSVGGPPLAILGDSTGARRSPGLKVGDTYAGWEIVEIGENVVVSASGRRETLVKGTAPRERAVTTTAAITPPPVARTPVNTVSAATPDLSPATVNPDPNSNLPAVAPPGTVFQYTPFGPVLVTPK